MRNCCFLGLLSSHIVSSPGLLAPTGRSQFQKAWGGFFSLSLQCGPPPSGWDRAQGRITVLLPQPGRLLPWGWGQKSQALLGLRQDKVVQVAPARHPSASPADLDKASRGPSKGTRAAGQHCPAHCRLPQAPQREERDLPFSLHFVRRQLTSSPADYLGLNGHFWLSAQIQEVGCSKDNHSTNFGGALGIWGCWKLVSL